MEEKEGYFSKQSMGRDGGSLGEGLISGHRRTISGYILAEEIAGLVLYMAYAEKKELRMPI